MRGRALYALCLAIVPGTLRAHGPEVAAARAVSAAFFKAMEAADWKAAAGFLDLPVLERERQSAVEGTRRQRTMPPMTVERLIPRGAALEQRVQRHSG